MATEHGGTPIWAEPAPGTRRPRFTREQIAAAALALADAEGFEAVSMRRVAAELGAGTMTLYHYVRTKDDLIALMDDAVMAEVLIPEGELPTDWRAALTAIARRTRDMSLRHRGLLQGLRNARLGPNALRHSDQSLAALAGTTLDPGSKLDLLAAVDDYVVGNVLRAGEPLHDGEVSADTARFLREQLEHDDLPHLRSLLGTEAPHTEWARLASATTAEERFEEGLRALLDGAAGRYGI
ncbi:TetR/AcrR family transcriptional regulator [Saccharopolyspora sp. NFXS83]|uniref:TetR/AcrR family transcriptional regulator n=1 Tax=Saccharopolyspora sp. NFXS83 TaxID=2993560 RepID=UPI00224B3BDE|nr:TetR/AcrR family transcriptional regulator [Saccharopolyspora sp. NFXS83]MCX2733053.1 TetR/AcrR family transcriptional regulator [Saccharopolyspora sp. NFXS83]